MLKRDVNGVLYIVDDTNAKIMPNDKVVLVDRSCNCHWCAQLQVNTVYTVKHNDEGILLRLIELPDNFFRGDFRKVKLLRDFYQKK